jgi:hypothetical protein
MQFTHANTDYEQYLAPMTLNIAYKYREYGDRRNGP